MTGPGGSTDVVQGWPIGDEGAIQRTADALLEPLHGGKERREGGGGGAGDVVQWRWRRNNDESTGGGGGEGVRSGGAGTGGT